MPAAAAARSPIRLGKCFSLSAANSAARPPWWATEMALPLAQERSCLGLVLCLCFIAGCTHPMSQRAAPLRDINAVLAYHDDELLAIPGVVGVYVGLLNDEKTPCLKVMLARKDARL